MQAGLQLRCPGSQCPSAHIQCFVHGVFVRLPYAHSDPRNKVVVAFLRGLLGCRYSCTDAFRLNA